jgi:hypothetical protein
MFRIRKCASLATAGGGWGSVAGDWSLAYKGSRTVIIDALDECGREAEIRRLVTFQTIKVDNL